MCGGELGEVCGGELGKVCGGELGEVCAVTNLPDLCPYSGDLIT